MAVMSRAGFVYRPGTYKPTFSFAAPRGPATLVAVLPFVNMTADEDAGYLCDGLAEELITLLSRSEGLSVMGRTSSFQFKGLALDAREIGHRLGAALLIEGAVRGTRDRYLVTVRLISISDGCEVWSERYDRSPADLLALETEIAASVASVLTAGRPPANTTTDKRL